MNHQTCCKDRRHSLEDPDRGQKIGLTASLWDPACGRDGTPYKCFAGGKTLARPKLIFGRADSIRGPRAAMAVWGELKQKLLELRG